MFTSSPSDSIKIVLMSTVLLVLLVAAYFGLYFFYLMPLKETGEHIFTNVSSGAQDFKESIGVTPDQYNN